MRKVLALSICALVFVAGAYAQATAGLGSVSGTVRDASGAVIPGATVVVANEGKGIKRTMNTTDAAIFAAPALTPASGYSITVTKQGFATYEVKDFEILVGQNVDFKVGLQVGSATTKVDVTCGSAAGGRHQERRHRHRRLGPDRQSADQRPPRG